MLEGLSKVDWDLLTHAYGPAADIPDVIKACTSDDPEVWVDAIDNLYAALCHQQSTIYDATAKAIPFLLELLTCPQIRCRGRILEFLGDCAAASSFLAVHQDLSTFTERRNSSEFQAQLSEELQWVSETRVAIWAGLDVYLGLLTDPNPRIRMMVPFTLARLAQHASQEAPNIREGTSIEAHLFSRFKARFGSEPDEPIRASLAFAMSRLSLPESLSFLEIIFSDPKAGVAERLAATLGYVESAQSHSQGAIQILASALKDREFTNRLFKFEANPIEIRHHPLGKAYRAVGLLPTNESETGFDFADVGQEEDFTFPWIEGWATTRILEVLSSCGQSDLESLLPALIPFLDEADPFDDSVIEPILQLAFSRDRMEVNSCDLTKSQKTILRHLFDNLLLWATDICNVQSLWEKFGLPDGREEWRVLLQIEAQPLTDLDIEEILARIAPSQQYSWQGPSIKRLNLREIGNSDFLRHLTRYTELEHLDLSSIPLRDEDLTHLAALKKLKNLQLPSTGISDAALAFLENLPSLTEINLSRTNITDAGVRRLQKVTTLQTISIWRTDVSQEAIAQFKLACPGCTVR